MDKAQLCTVGISWKRQVAVLLPKTSGVCSLCVFPLWVFHPSPLAGAQADICVSVVLTFEGGGELLGKKRRLLGVVIARGKNPAWDPAGAPVVFQRGQLSCPQSLLSPKTPAPPSWFSECYAPAGFLHPRTRVPWHQAESCLGLRREALFP